MATLKANKAAAGVQPRMVHAGTNSVKFVFTAAAALSAGDVIQLAKLPHGAIFDSMLLVRTGAGQFTCSIGDGGDVDRYAVSATLVVNTVIGEANLLYTGVGHQYNVSDDATEQFDTIDLTVTTVTTAVAGGVITGIVQYHADEADPA